MQPKIVLLTITAFVAYTAGQSYHKTVQGPGVSSVVHGHHGGLGGSGIMTQIHQKLHTSTHGLSGQTATQGHHAVTQGLVGNVHATAQGHHAPLQGSGGNGHVAIQGHHGQSEKGHDHAAYKFEYGVKDSHTHDAHSQSEHRDGKHVVGEYTLHEADGTQRVVKYKSGPHTGFEAIVERQGHAQHPAPHGHEKDGKVATSYVGVTHWMNQGEDAHGH